MVEDEKCGPEMGYLPYGGATSFADMMAMEEAQEAMAETYKLTDQFSMMASNVMNSLDIAGKGAALKALADEYASLVGEAMAEKAYRDKWGESISSRDETKDKGGYLVSGDEGDHLPTTEDGKLSHRLMGAAWAALHGGYRGNKYEGPGKAQAIAKLKKLYAQEGMDTPAPEGKGNDEVPADEKAGRRIRSSMMDKLKSAWATIKELMDWAEQVDDDPGGEMGMAGFIKGYGIAVKNVNGQPWIIAYSTNAFEDREKEIFSTKALEKYVTQAEQKNDRGYFNFWHIPGTDFAEKQWQAVPGRFLVEAGPFLDNEIGQAALKFFEQFPDGHIEIAPEGWGCSPEYRYLPEERKTGTYENIWITRTSILPRLAAANIWTKAGVEMAYTEQQKQAANALFGESLAAKILGSAEDATKELEQADVRHKSADESPPETETPDNSVGVVLEALAALDLPALSATIQQLTEGQNQLNTRLDELTGQVKGIEKAEAIKNKTELPRFAWQALQRASEAEKTIIADDDALKDKKPAETKPPVTDQSGAAAFFPARR